MKKGRRKQILKQDDGTQLEIVASNPSPAPPQKYYEDGVGQYILYPDLLQKPFGAVVDRIVDIDSIDRFLAENKIPGINELIDDTTIIDNENLDISTKVVLEYPTLTTEESDTALYLDAFDMEVLDAVASLYENSPVMTAKAIYKVMIGKKHYRNVTKEQQQAVISSLEKCGRMTIKISLTELLKKDSRSKQKLKDAGLTVNYSGQLISYGVITVDRKNQNPYSEYLINVFNIPPIFSYAKSIGKVFLLPLDIVNTSNVNKTRRTIILQSFLLRKIISMYKEDNGSYIYIRDIYKAIDCADDSAQHKLRHRECTERILASWVDKKFICGYDCMYEGRTPIAYQIRLNANWPEQPELGT